MSDMVNMSRATRRRLSSPRKRTTLNLPTALVEEAMRELGYTNLTEAVIHTLDDALRDKVRRELLQQEDLFPTPEELEATRRQAWRSSAGFEEPEASLG
jgi:Arc/MetJ family transcription regulator